MHKDEDIKAYMNEARLVYKRLQIQKRRDNEERKTAVERLQDIGLVAAIEDERKEAINRNELEVTLLQFTTYMYLAGMAGGDFEEVMAKVICKQVKNLFQAIGCTRVEDSPKLYENTCIEEKFLKNENRS